MFPAWAVWIAGLAIALIAGYFWRRWRAAQLRARRQLAILDFGVGLEQLAERFLAAAQATGKPRGLRWKSVELHDERCFARDRATGELYALVGATVSFEAVAGGGMEDVEAVGNLRYVTAVFIHRNGDWTTDGRAVFNHGPHEALTRYSETLEPLPGENDEAAGQSA